MQIYINTCIIVCMYTCMYIKYVVKMIENVPTRLLPIYQWLHGNSCMHLEKWCAVWYMLIYVSYMIYSALILFLRDMGAVFAMRHFWWFTVSNALWKGRNTPQTNLPSSIPFRIFSVILINGWFVEWLFQKPNW